MRRVAVTGLGVVAPGAIGVDAFWGQISHGVSAAGRIMKFDPSGHDRLRMAKRIRRAALREGGAKAVAEHALRHFVLPGATDPLSARLDRPLFPPLPERAIPTRIAS